jgi:hypothetical protein
MIKEIASLAVLFLVVSSDPFPATTCPQGAKVCAPHTTTVKSSAKVRVLPITVISVPRARHAAAQPAFVWKCGDWKTLAMGIGSYKDCQNAPVQL